MPEWNYSIKLADESKIAKAIIREVPVHPKVMVEVANSIYGMPLQKAKRYLNEVIAKREAIPFRSSHKKVSHKKGLSDRWGWPSGRYPVKAAKYMLKVLDNVENNAENKGLEVDKLVIFHIGIGKGLTLKRAMPRAFGRADVIRKFRSNIEVMVRMEG
ncbi:MAG: 50S ribosomal protein L22 [Caldisphaera sp.]|jgi:large subunit ribosomal protein L22|nr:50S ribosomal protein L22 [Caldisphaera sp.]PMP59393.1 MAG: 50S ribosomal protein L22 [Caldisphaera sp.]